MQLQPLTHEIVDESICLAVGEQPVDFFQQPFALQSTTSRRSEQPIVRHRTPEEVRQPRRELRIVEPVARDRVAFDEIDKVPRCQHSLQRNSIGVGRLLTGITFRAKCPYVIRQFLLLDSPPPCSLGEPLQVFGDHFDRRVIRRQQTVASRSFRLGFERSFPLDPIQQHRGKESVSLVVEHLRSVRLEQSRFAAMREDVAAAVEGVAEGCTGPTINDIGRDDAKVERHWHFQKHFELMHLRAVLGSRDVEIDEAIDSLFAGPLADAEVRRLAADRTNAARLNADFVKPAVLRTAVAKPVRRQRLMHVAGIKQMPQRALDTEPVHHFLLSLPAVVTQLGSGLANLASLARRNRKGTIQYEPRRAVVAINMGRRKRQLGPNPLEAVPQRVFVQFARFGRIVAHAEQVIDRILVFLATEPIVCHRRPRCHARCLTLLKERSEIRDERCNLRLCWPGLCLRRHFATVDPLEGFCPVVAIQAPLEVARQPVDPDISLFLLRAMTADAVLLQKRFKRLGSVNGTTGAEASGKKEHVSDKHRIRSLRAGVRTGPKTRCTAPHPVSGDAAGQ